MAGCLAAGSGLVAYGSTVGQGGGTQPALWRSGDGTSWSRIAVAAFATGTPAPLVSVAQAKGSWLAAANPDPGVDPFVTGAAGRPGPAATSGTDAGVGPAPSVDNGRTGLWLSLNGGSAWQLINTSTAPWMGGDRSEIDLVGFAPPADGAAVHATTTSTSATSTGPSGAGPAVPVVVGVVDGRLAVWTGTSA
jgi:hypothetical protein